MAALFLFVLAVAGAVVVGDLVWENTTAAEVIVFGQPVTGYSQGWLLAMAATLGVVVAVLLVARWRRPRGAGSVAASSAGCGGSDASTEPSRKPNPPACSTSGSATMTPERLLFGGGGGSRGFLFIGGWQGWASTSQQPAKKQPVGGCSPPGTMASTGGRRSCTPPGTTRRP
jgi:hypothetical protein